MYKCYHNILSIYLNGYSYYTLAIDTGHGVVEYDVVLLVEQVIDLNGEMQSWPGR